MLHLKKKKIWHMQIGSGFFLKDWIQIHRANRNSVSRRDRGFPLYTYHSIPSLFYPMSKICSPTLPVVCWVSQNTRESDTDRPPGEGAAYRAGTVDTNNWHTVVFRQFSGQYIPNIAPGKPGTRTAYLAGTVNTNNWHKVVFRQFSGQYSKYCIWQAGRRGCLPRRDRGH